MLQKIVFTRKLCIPSTQVPHENFARFFNTKAEREDIFNQ